MFSKKIIFLKFLIIIFSGILLVSFLIYAWTPPSSNPPEGNPPPPINTGDEAQTKTGNLNIGGGLKYWITKVGDSFALKNDSGAVKFILGQDGNVGIGTTGPSERLTISLDDSATSSVAILLGLNKTTTGTAGAGIGAGLMFRAEADDGSLVDLAKITSSFDNASSTSPNTSLHFYTRGGGSLTEALTIDESGNVGIGTTNPQATLDVNGRIKAQDPIDGNDVATKAYVDAQGGGTPYIDWSDCQVKSVTFCNGENSATISCEVGYVAVNFVCGGMGSEEHSGTGKSAGFCKLTDVNELYVKRYDFSDGYGCISGSIKCCKYVTP